MSKSRACQPRDRRRRGGPVAGLPVWALALALGAACLPGPGWSQAIQGEPHDLVFHIINATTGGPGTIQRLEMSYQGTLGGKILDENPAESEITFRNVPVKPEGHYVVTAWAGGVPYFWNLRGETMIEQPTTLHVFDTTEDLADVRITGLNAVFHLQQSLVKIEYMINASNSASPQITITGRPSTLEITVPPGTTDLTAVYLRGPDPIPIEIHNAGLDRIGLAAPLTSGNNQIKVEGMVTWTGDIDFSLATNVPVAAWSLLTSPESLQAESFELEPDLDNVIPGYRRMIGPALTADQGFRVHLVKTGGAEPEQDLFTTAEPAAQAAAAETAADTGGKGAIIPIVLGLGVLAIVVLIVVARRR